MRGFVIGNAAWDETLHLAALPEAGASVHVCRGTEGPGGKGANQAAVLARAGCDVTLVAAVGDDARGRLLRTALATEGLAHGLVTLAGVSTDWSVVLVSAAGENAILTTRQAALGLGAGHVDAALAPARAGDLCVLQGNLSPETTAAAARAARRRGMVVALNPSPADRRLAALFSEADVLFVNCDEARFFAGEGGAAALSALGSSRVVLTLGAEGALLAAGGTVEAVPAAAARVVDPTGAGDVFMATALAHAATRAWLPDAAALSAAAQAAALSVGRAGAFAALPTQEELGAIIGRR